MWEHCFGREARLPTSPHEGPAHFNVHPLRFYVISFPPVVSRGRLMSDS